VQIKKMTDQYTRDEIDTGRKLFTGDWQFFAAANSPQSLPKMRATEIAFAGRSNVGKSSLINALTARKALARTSRTPGRTQELIFFTGGGELTVVDMPGYGYAAAAKSKIAAWTDLIEAYLHGRANLARVYVLIDSRHGLKATDDATFKVLGAAAVSYQIILTKADTIKPSELETRIKEVEAGLSKWPSAYPTVLATSGHEGTGIPQVRAAVARLLNERKR
jgi:GTP-binding protein